MLIAAGMVGLTAKAWGVSLNLEDIRGLMQERKYEAASQLLRAYIKTQPQAFAAWDMLGVAYYQMGDVQQALRVLKTSAGQSPDPAYNLLFQGLSFAVLQQNKLAAHYLKQAANASEAGAYARLATFEIAAWYYNRRKLVRAKRWIRIYLERYPSGRHAPLLREVQRGLQLGNFVGQLPQMRRPDLVVTFFAQHPLSLMPIPHYWLVDTGTIYGEKTGAQISNQRDYSFSISDDYVLWAIRLTTGIGLGPFKQDGFEMHLGYTYHQIWNSTPERFFVYSQDPLDIKYFPFRPDLQSRYHHLYFKSKYTFPSYFSVGVAMSAQMERMGSRLSGPQPWNISENHFMSYDFDVAPWVGLQFNPRHALTPYMYVFRQVNVEDPNFSHQTLTSSLVPNSFGVRYEGLFPRADLKVELGSHYYQYLYNDPYLDNKEWQVGGAMFYTLLRNLYLTFGASYARKTFTQPRLKVNQCSLQLKQGGAGQDEEKFPPAAEVINIIRCDRKDTVLQAHTGVVFTWRQNYGVFARAQVHKNMSNIAEREFHKYMVLAGITMAFPNVAKVDHYQQLPARKPLDLTKNL